MVTAIIAPGSGAIRRALSRATLRQSAHRADIGNPWNRSPWKAATAWGSGQVVTAGAVRSNAGNLYCAVTAGTTSSAAPTHGASAPNAWDGPGSTGVKWTWLGPVEITADVADGPTIINRGASDPGGYPVIYGNNSSIGARYLPNAFAVRGGYRIASPSGAAKTFDSKAGVSAYARAYWEFETDAPKLLINMNAGGSRSVQIYIDGRRYNYDGIGCSPGFNYLEVTHASTRTRRYRVSTTDGFDQIYGVYTAAQYQVWAPSEEESIRSYWISDSILQGSAYGPFLIGGSAPVMVSDMMGWTDPWVAAMGGTGYIATGASSYYTYGERVAEGLTRNPDIWCLMGSTNDGGSGAAAITAAALATYRAIRAGSSAPIVVFGVWPINAGALTIENAIKDAVTAFNDPLTFFVPIAADTATGNPWVLAAHNNSNFTAANFAPVAFADGTHPAEFGTQYLARRMVAALRGQVLPAIRR